MCSSITDVRHDAALQALALLIDLEEYQVRNADGYFRSDRADKHGKVPCSELALPKPRSLATNDPSNPPSWLQVMFRIPWLPGGSLHLRRSRIVVLGCLCSGVP